MVSVSTFEIMRRYFQCFDINDGTINLFDVLRNISNIQGSAFYENNINRSLFPSLMFDRVLITPIKPVITKPHLLFLT